MSARVLCLLFAACVYAIDPQHAQNITVYHVNQGGFGAAPVNMDTGDAGGDMCVAAAVALFTH